MCWVIHTPTPDEGAALTGMTPEQWQLEFGVAYWRGSLYGLNALGVNTQQFREWGQPRSLEQDVYYGSFLAALDAWNKSPLSVLTHDQLRSMLDELKRKP